jgi:hypothetical protein
MPSAHREKETCSEEETDHIVALCSIEDRSTLNRNHPQILRERLKLKLGDIHSSDVGPL